MVSECSRTFKKNNESFRFSEEIVVFYPNNSFHCQFQIFLYPLLIGEGPVGVGGGRGSNF